MLESLRWHARTVATLLRVAVPRPRLRKRAPVLPGPEQKRIVTPLPAPLVDAYLRHFDLPSDLDELPAHFFAMWTLGPAVRTLLGLPYPMHRGLNAGCSLELDSPLPRDRPLALTTRLLSIEDDERRVLFHVAADMGPKDRPEALRAKLSFILPRRHKGPRQPPQSIPPAATELWRSVLPPDAGLAYARLTGDFNPIHWLRPYARMMGHKSVILHGYAQLAYVMEAVHRHLGDRRALQRMEVRFVAPLVLPANAGVYLTAPREVMLGTGPGERATVTGTFAAR